MDYNLDVIEAHLKDMGKTITQLEQMYAAANSDLSEVDKEICDIYHYIEFANLDACRGYKAYQMLKERLVRRREVKNCQEVLGCVKGSGFTSKHKDRALNKINEQRKLKYKPRVLNELFGKE